MKKLMQRFFGIAVSAAMLFTSGMTAVAADGHNHYDGTPIDTSSATPPYTITLTHPNGEDFVSSTEPATGSHYGAYQIFSGTVEKKEYSGNPGTEGTAIPITDIKWGNAFGIVPNVSEEVRDTNILGFVYALSKAQTGDYKYAFGDFDGFSKDFFDGTTLASKFTKDGITDVTVNVPDNKVTKIENDSNVNYDKLAVAIADVLAAHAKNHEWLQAFTDILGGYARAEGGYKNPSYVNRFYEGEVNKDDAKKYEIHVPAGYYMVRDLSEVSKEDESFSARMLFVANDITQVLKESVPKLDKEILRDGGKYETEAAGVGDVVEFELTGTLPSNYDNYLGGYQYTFEDTLSTGLDLSKKNGTVASDGEANGYVVVKVKGLYSYDVTGKILTWNPNLEIILPLAFSGNKTDINDNHHLSTAPSDDQSENNYDATYKDHTLTVKFMCLKEIRIVGTGDDGLEKGTVYRLGYKDKDVIDGIGKVTTNNSSKIYVDYYAKVNQNAVVSPKDTANDNGNYNQAQIEYSDNPQAYGDTDTTTIDRATVYTFGLDIIKVDAAEFLRKNGSAKSTNDSALEGAEFAIVRPKDASITDDTEWEIAKFKYVTSADALAESANGANLPERFLLGYYSITSWETITDAAGKNVTGKILNEDWLKKYPDEPDATEIYNIASQENGVLNVSGLDVDVTYTMAETKVPQNGPDSKPASYAKIAPFTIELTAHQGTDKEYDGTLDNAVVPNKVGTDESFTFEKFVQLNDTSYKNGSANMLVANFKYTDLPSTGGVGTVWFYILGAGGVGLAGVLFFLSKKKVTK